MHKIFSYIKKGCLSLALMGSSANLYAQITPKNSTLPPATPITVPEAYTNTIINYIRTWEPNKPTSDPSAVISAANVSEVKQSTQYFDGLDRPLQAVSKGSSPEGRDLVAPVIYDPFGREQFKYLPYVQQSSNTSDGKFKTDPFNAQKVFYQNTTLNPGATGESVYYNRVNYEAASLNRVLKTYNPGNSWAKQDAATMEKGGNRPVENQYLVNTVADSVRIWNMGSSILPFSSGYYGVGTLYKNVTIAENEKQIVEYKDKEDKVILKKVQISASPGSAHVGWLCTYYVYDGLNNLRLMIPPQAVMLIRSDWNLSSAVADGLCFIYRYDSRNRMITKKVPGADSAEMVYDVHDRLVFTRDGNMADPNQPGGAKWLTTFYDEFNRPVMTALYTSSSTREVLQASMNTATSNTQAINYNIPAVTDLVVGFHNGRATYTAGNSITFENGFDSGNGEMLAEINPNATQGTVSITATNPLPNIPTSALTPLIYTFYDKYGFSGVHNPATSDFNSPQKGDNLYEEAITGVSNKTKGLITGTKVKVLDGSNQWLTTTTYYNDKGRMIQAITDNIGGGKDIATNLFDFSGKLLSSYRKHSNSRSGTIPITRVLTMLTYDHAGRLTSVRKKLNDEEERTVAANEYDELGQLKTKRLGIKGGSAPLETLNYEYNLRGWLKGINKSFVNTDQPTTPNWFGQELCYDHGFTANQYNGNIAGIKWKSQSDQKPRAYGYSYDSSSRLTGAAFTQQNTPGAKWTRDAKDFSVSGITYDANGNIGSMIQKGMTGPTTIATIDQFTYTYQPNSNKLAKVADPSNTTVAKLGDFINGTNTGDDYDYDSNGNLIKDLNKKIASIIYNHMSLPENISATGKGTIRYLYDATGNKLRKTVTDNIVTPSKVTTTDYIGGFVYQNDTLQFVSHEEGRVRTVFKTGQPIQYFYDYFVKDHLGNVRMVLTDQTDFTMYAATMETERASTETALFSNIEETRSPKPIGYPQDNTTQQNASVAKLNASDGGKKIGPSLALRVMAGDTIQIGAKAFYKSQGPTHKKSVTSPEEMVASLVRAFAGSNNQGNTHNTVTLDQLSPFAGNFNSNDYQRLKEKDPNQNKQDKPKAYLNFVLFDDEFNLVEENSGVRQIKEESDQLQILAVDKMTMKKNGFLYVYMSNETAQDVFFDNVTVLANPGPLLEETHYYPFGLTMSAISSNALKGLNYPENRFKFNGKLLHDKEFLDGTGLLWYDYGNREYDQQIGRFHRIDPLTHEFAHLTPYQYAGNEPVKNIDLDGLEPKPAVESWDLKTAKSHTYSSNQKAFLIDGYWTNIQEGSYNNVYQYYEKGVGWREFIPRTQEYYNRARAAALDEVAQGLAIGFSSMLMVGTSLFTGGLSLQGLTARGLGAGTADIAGQMLTSGGSGFDERLKDVNWTSVGASMFMKNPFGASMVGSAFDFRIEGGFNRSLFGNTGTSKSLSEFGIESVVGGIAGKYTDMGLNHLGLNSYSGLKSMITGGLNRTGVISLHFGASGITAVQLNALNNIISEALKTNESKDKK